MGRAPSVLSIVRLTSARPSGGRPAVPAKMTSSILPPRRLLAPCSPITQLRASTTFDFPEPFGPTTQVMPGSSRSVVADAKDLKPRSVRVFRCTKRAPRRDRGPREPTARPTPRPAFRAGRSALPEALHRAGGRGPAMRHPGHRARPALRRRLLLEPGEQLVARGAWAL